VVQTLGGKPAQPCWDIDVDMPVRAFPFFAVGLLVAATAAGPVASGPNDVHAMVQAGEIMPFEAIQRRVVQETAGEYVGSHFDPNSRVYRFRFLQNGNLINVDVDARTGDRIRRRQNF
jgi:hypothetical protein